MTVRNSFKRGEGREAERAIILLVALSKAALGETTKESTSWKDAEEKKKKGGGKERRTRRRTESMRRRVRRKEMKKRVDKRTPLVR